MFELGDVVQLKSGGPRMTISSKETTQTHLFKKSSLFTIYRCTYYDKRNQL